jgi:hypothetical protein
VTGTSSWTGDYYLFDVQVYVPETGRVEHNLVTDPYSRGPVHQLRTQPAGQPGRPVPGPGGLVAAAETAAAGRG